MKCPNCGSEEFYVNENVAGVEVNGCPVVAYVCKKCGKVEFYAPKVLEKAQKEAKENFKKESLKAEIRAQKDDLLAEKNKLKMVLADGFASRGQKQAAEARIFEIDLLLKKLDD